MFDPTQGFVDLAAAGSLLQLEPLLSDDPDTVSHSSSIAPGTAHMGPALTASSCVTTACMPFHSRKGCV